MGIIADDCGAQDGVSLGATDNIEGEELRCPLSTGRIYGKDYYSGKLNEEIRDL